MRHRGDRVARDVTDEIRFHIEERIAELVSGGVEVETARKRALAEFGNVESACEELMRMDRRRAGRARRSALLSEIVMDVRYGVRSLVRRPAVLAVLLSTIGIGVGAPSAIFAVANAALFRALPYDDPDRLVRVWETYGDGAGESEASYPDYEAWSEAGVFTALEGYDPTNVTVESGSGATMLRGARVSSGFFGMLGVDAALGRTFDAADVGVDADVVVLADRYWRAELGADGSVLTQTVRIDGRDHRIVGVMPAGFQFAPAGDAVMWLPLNRDMDALRDRSNHWFSVVGRLADGVSAARAGTALSSAMSRLARAYPATNAGRDVRVVALREQVAGKIRPLLTALFGAAALLLVISCANMAGLLLARSLSRGPEFAARVALGANRRRVIRQVMTESLLLAVAGAAIGLLVAAAGTKVLVAWLPGGVLDGMPYLRGVRPDRNVFGFSAIVATLAGLGFGTAPAAFAWRSGMAGLSSAGRMTAGVRGARLRDALVVGELALTVVLLVGTGLVTRSLRRLASEHPGFEAGQVITARVALAGPAYRQPEVQQRFFEDALARIRRVPGVLDAGAVTNLPLSGSGRLTYQVEGGELRDPAHRLEALRRGVAGDYFTVLRIPVLSGRAPGADDDATSGRVIAISESMARAIFANGEAVGHRLRFDAMPSDTWTIVGVVGDVKTGSLDAPAPHTIYYSHLQLPENRLTLAVRVAAGAGGFAMQLPDEVHALDPSIAVYGVETMEQVVSISAAMFARRFPLILIGTFAGAALLLAVIGVYGVASYTVARRTREFGIRSALGATRLDVVGLVLRRGMSLALVGVAGGVALAIAFAPLLASILYGVTITDPPSYAISAVILAVAGTLGCIGPALRASNASPSLMLRGD